MGSERGDINYDGLWPHEVCTLMLWKYLLWIPRIFSKWLWSYCAKDNIWLIYSVVVIMNMDSKKNWFPLICLSFFFPCLFFFYVVFVTSSNFASSCSAINESLTLANIITGPRRKKWKFKNYLMVFSPWVFRPLK